MTAVFSQKKFCYCAFCRNPKFVHKKKRIGIFNILASAFGAVVITAAVFQEPHPIGIGLFIAFLVTCEVFLQIRWRLSVVCKQCGFDPVLYLRDTSSALAKVKAQLVLRKTDPSYMLAEPLNLPVRIRTADGAFIEKSP